MKKLFSLILVISLVLTFFTFPSPVSAQTSGTLTIYPEYPDMLPRDGDYEVTLIQGDKTVTIPVYNAARKADSFASNSNNFRRFCEFAFTGEVTVKVTPRFRIHAYAVLPSSKGIASRMIDGAITFTIDKPQNLFIRVNDDKNTILSIFAEAPETNVPSDSDPNVIYFKAGLNNTNDTYTSAGSGRFYVPEGKTVYLEPGALVTLRPFLRASNVTIKGRGAFIDPQTTRYNDWAFFATINDNINAGNGNQLKNVTFEGIKMLDANAFNICIRYADNLTIDNVKVLSNQISTDGISMWGATGDITNVTVKNCYLFNNDDMLVMSKIGSVTIKDCIFANAHRFLITQNDIDTLVIENADIFGLETLVRATGTSEANNWKSITLRNVFVEDALSLNNVINVRNGTSNPKNMVLENVSLPATFNNGIYINNAQGVNLTLNNVYVGGQPVTCLADFPKSYVCAGNTVTFGTSFNATAAKANSHSNARKSCNHQGSMRIKVGGRQLGPSQAVPYTQNNITYVPAVDVLNALGYKAQFDGTTLTFNDGDEYVMKLNEGAYYKNGERIKTDKLTLSNGCVMMSFNVLKSLGYQPYISNGTVMISSSDTFENLIKQSGFEDASSPFAKYTDDVNYLYSTNWSSFDFGSIYVTDKEKYTGNYSALVTKEITSTVTDSGISQVFTPALRKYGAGTYHLEFYAKLDPETPCENPNIWTGIVRGSWRVQEGGVPLDINDYKQFTLTNDWQKFSYDIVISDPTLEGYGNSFLFFGSAQTSTSTASGAKMYFYLDDVSLTYSTPVTSSTLSSVLSQEPTRENEIFKGWYDNAGNLVTAQTQINGTLLVHPEFIYAGDINNNVIIEKVVSVGGVDRYPSECRLGVHIAVQGGTEFNVIDSDADQSIQANADLKNGKVKLTTATRYYSQARRCESDGWKSGTLFDYFDVSAAPNGYTPKTVALDYDANKKLFVLPKGITLYVGDTITFKTDKTVTDPCPLPANATYTNNMYVQGAQVRIGGGETTGLRFVNVINADFIKNLQAMGYKNVTFGTLVSRTNGYSYNEKLTFAKVSEDVAVDVKGQNIFLTSEEANASYQKYTACVINIPTEYLKTNIYARPYIKYTDLSGGEHILYGEQYGTNIYAVAEKAYDAEETQHVKDLLYNQILKHYN